jgi:hypothetical protein
MSSHRCHSSNLLSPSPSLCPSRQNRRWERGGNYWDEDGHCGFNLRLSQSQHNLRGFCEPGQHEDSPRSYLWPPVPDFINHYTTLCCYFTVPGPESYLHSELKTLQRQKTYLDLWFLPRCPPSSAPTSQKVSKGLLMHWTPQCHLSSFVHPWHGIKMCRRLVELKKWCTSVNEKWKQCSIPFWVGSSLASTKLVALSWLPCAVSQHLQVSLHFHTVQKVSSCLLAFKDMNLRSKEVKFTGLMT